MSSVFAPIGALLGLVFLGLFIWAAFSPFETLGWWAGWFGDKIYEDNLPSDGFIRKVTPDASAYVIFLSGIGRVSGQTLSYREQDFLRHLAVALPDAVIIDDIFPYSVNNMALTGQPFFGRLWRWALRRKLDGPALAGMLINVRNTFQCLISLDHRYGPIYNQATGEVLLHGLMRYDYPTDSDTPIFIIGYSGAGQMAVGATTYLREWLSDPIYVISLGGLFGSDQGLLAANHIYHLSGSTDKILMMNYIAPGRWPIFATSEFNRAKRQGRITNINMGPMNHTGRTGYLDSKTFLADGTSFVDHTVNVVAGIVDDVLNGSMNSVGSEQHIAGNSHGASLAAEADASKSDDVVGL